MFYAIESTCKSELLTDDNFSPPDYKHLQHTCQIMEILILWSLYQHLLLKVDFWQNCYLKEKGLFLKPYEALISYFH